MHQTVKRVNSKVPELCINIGPTAQVINVHQNNVRINYSVTYTDTRQETISTYDIADGDVDS